MVTMKQGLFSRFAWCTSMEQRLLSASLATTTPPGGGGGMYMYVRVVAEGCENGQIQIQGSTNSFHVTNNPPQHTHTDELGMVEVSVSSA